MRQVPREGTLFIHSSRKIRGLSPRSTQIVEHYNIEFNWMDAMISDRSVLVCEVPLCPQRVRFFFFFSFDVFLCDVHYTTEWQ